MKSKKRSRLFGIFAGVSFSVTSICAQNYLIDSYTIDGGGGNSSGGIYQLSGTVGQPDAGAKLTGGNYSLTGGFWSMLVAVQTEGAPLLKVQLSGANTVAVFWTASSTGYVLQQNSNLNTTNWVNVVQTPSNDGTNKTVLIPSPTGNMFYRLKK